MFLLAFFIVNTVVGTPVRCPTSSGFTVGRSCFKYMTDQMFQHSQAEHYCENTVGGRLAVLDTRRKMKAAIDFFHTKFDEEDKDGGVPTAWVQGHWVPGTKHLRYSSGVVNRKPHWMTPTRNSHTGKYFHWPTSSLFGWEATCVAVSLWRRRSPSMGTRASAGVYNVPCDSIYWTHALCEVTI